MQPSVIHAASRDTASAGAPRGSHVAHDTGTDKALFTTLVTPYGVRTNAHRYAVFDATMDASALFAV